MCGQSLREQIQAVVCCSKDTLDHPIMHPLAELLEHELDVVKAACKAIDVHNTTSARYEALVLSLLELRTAIVSWEGRQGQRQGQVRHYIFLTQRRVTFECVGAKSIFGCNNKPEEMCSKPYQSTRSPSVCFVFCNLET